MNIVKIRFLLVVLFTPCSAAEVAISSIAELAEYAAKDGNTVTLAPGDYEITDYLSIEQAKERRKNKDYPIIVFSGSGNTFNLTGAKISYDTNLRRILNPPVHSNEFIVSGNSNTITGMNITCIGDGTSPGGCLVEVSGKKNFLKDVRLLVKGSSPYGYGDLFGKGGPGVIAHRKHSGLLITGDGTRLDNCHLTMRSFGHGIFIQKDAADVLIENCRVEGEMRATKDILAETDTPAAEVKFRTTVRTRSGEFFVLPGYMKSLSEDAFRTYGQHKNLRIKNCKAVNMRGGFELRSKAGATLENCSATGCERGFWISTDTTLTSCKGDAKYGPLLYVEGDNATVDLTLLSGSEPGITVHALAAIYGSGNRIVLKSAGQPGRSPLIPILLGYHPPGAGENMAPYGQRPAKGLALTNDTGLPLTIGEKAENCTITTNGPIIENLGRNITVK